ncbi:hypothetical protein PHBOTO_003445 [Pseudozyma hubeiensis]|nr:hypothetical protein PHBOTO_003445 [Pseudozyma hubeiensis]
MPPSAWAGESSSSIAVSMNPRDSRVVSIYDKYLYDPRDLESSDPRRRELARKASQLKLHGQPANNMDANGLRHGGPLTQGPAQGKSATISHATKAATSSRRPSDGGASVPHQDHTHDRDSGAFGLGLGMLGGSDSESDSDSDDDRPARNNSRLDELHRSQDSHRPDSWTDRAVAVGHRPPDNASQNPPSLKLMALKSAKQSAHLSGSSHDDRTSRLAVDNNNFVDRTSRHGSTIGFAGPPMENHAPPTTAGPADASKRLSARTALTKQLGLVTPNPEPTGPQSNRGPSPDPRAGPHDYFDSRAPTVVQARSPQRNPGPAPIDVARAQQHGLNTSQYSAHGASSPMGSQHGSVSTPNSATPLRSPGYGAPGMPSPNYPHGQAPLPPNILQRGPPSPYGQRGPPPPAGLGGPGVPSHPSSLQAASGTRPPPQHMQGAPGPQDRGGPASSRGPPGPGRNFGPSFSDAPGPSKRQSIFRRSMAMLGGGGPQMGPPGNGPSPNGAPQSQPGQKRRSFFRRSMAMLTGNNSSAQPPQQQAGQQMRMPAPAIPRASPAPRVKGLQDDYEKPDHPRKSQFLGAGGDGAEWDTDGEGAKFWRRFSVAQKAAGTHKVEDGSRAWMASMASGRRKLIVMGAIALIVLVGIIVGVIVWREIVSPSGSNSDEPTSIYKANLGAKDSPAASSSAQGSATTTTRKAKATATSTATSSSWYSRSVSDAVDIQDVVQRHSRRAVTHELGAQRMRKRHFGRAVAAVSPPPYEQRASLAELD